MTAFYFEIEYIHRESGEVVTESVPEFRLAQSIAKGLAIAHGRRAIIRKKRAGETWSLLLVEPTEHGATEVLATALSKPDAVMVWRQWNHRKQGAVLVLWPASAAMPSRFTG